MNKYKLKLKNILSHSTTPWLVLIIAIYLTFIGWQITENAMERRIQESFDFRSEEIVDAVKERMLTYQIALNGGVGLFASVNRDQLPSRKSWKKFYKKLHIDNYFKSMQAFGFSLAVPKNQLKEFTKNVKAEGFPEFNIYPETYDSEYSSVLYIEPFEGKNLKAFGFNMKSDATRRLAMDTATNTGQTTISGIVTLPHEANQIPERGFLIYIPIYKDLITPDTPIEREKNILGWVYSSFRIEDFMQGLLGSGAPDVNFEIFDFDPTTKQQQILFNSKENLASDEDLQSKYARSKHFEILGRTWILNLTPRLSFLEQNDTSQAFALGLAGLLINILLFSIARQAGAKHRTKNKLLEQTEELDQFFTYSQDFLCVADTNGFFKKINPSFERELGFTSEELTNQTFIEFVHPDDKLKTLEEIKKLSLGYSTLQFQNRYQKKDGSYIYLSWNTTATADGKLYAVGRNTTKQVQIENDLLEAKNNALRTSKTKSQFLANMSHEIRTPLNSIIGMAELLKETPLDDEQKKYLSISKNAGENLLGIINDILDISKIESGYFRLERINFNIFDLIDEVNDLISTKAFQKGLNYATQINQQIQVNYIGDPLRIKQILINLINNAIKFCESGDVILTVNLNKNPAKKGTLLFAVSDTGIGIDKEKQKILFQAFTQADPSVTRKFGGTGLGLAISKHLTELMNGEIWLESLPGLGSTFSFTLDLQISELPKEISTTSKTTTQINGKLILSVSEHEINNIVLNDILSAQGAKIRACNSQDSALQLIEAMSTAGQYFDLILIDYKFRNSITGIEFANLIGAKLKNHFSPIIIIGTNKINLQNDQYIKFGINSIIYQPIKQTELLSEIEKVLENKIEDKINNSTSNSVKINTSPSDPKQKAALQILLVDDSQENRLIIKAYLKNTSHLITEAANGEIALEIAKSKHFDLIFMDMQMPILDGFGATKAIREWEKQNQLPATPIAALTAYALDEEKQKCLEAGCSLHLSKPIKKQLLLATLDSIKAPVHTEN